MEIIQHLTQLTALMAVDAEQRARAIIICGPEEIEKSLPILFDAYKAAEVHQANLTIQTRGPWQVYTRENGVIASKAWNPSPFLAAPAEEDQQIFQQCPSQPRQGSARKQP